MCYYDDDAYIRGVAICFPENDSRRITLLLIADRLEGALAYYKAVFRGEAPEWVPARVRLLDDVFPDVFGDEPFRGSGATAGEHDCTCNRWGAVSVTDRDGQSLGVKPREFEVVSWRRAENEYLHHG